MIYSKTLDVEDYHDIRADFIDYTIEVLKGTDNGLAHPHRKWEYALALRALLEIDANLVLDVGGGGTVFAPAATLLGMVTVQVDPEPYTDRVQAHARKIGQPLPYIQKDFLDFTDDVVFDAVTSISTIEHVEQDKVFFDKLLTFVRPGGLLVLTTDFHPSGEALASPHHLRTYNEKTILELYDRAKENFEWFGGQYDYTYRGEDVNNYTFASMILKRIEQDG